MVRAGLAGDASLGLIVAAVAVTSQITGQVQTLLTLTFWTLESLRAVRALPRRGGGRRRGAGGRRAGHAGGGADPAGGGIKVEGLSFRYWNRERPSLNDINLELPAGAVVALVGENGAGSRPSSTCSAVSTGRARGASWWTGPISRGSRRRTGAPGSRRPSRTRCTSRCPGLSGGQWQTVANARAADLVVVLDGGRVVEVGTHDTLSTADGLYAELFRLQARYFV